MPPPTVNGMKQTSAVRRTTSQMIARPSMARGDVEEDELIGPFLVIARGDLDGVARVAKVDEIRPLHHAAFVDVEAGNDPLGEHAQSIPGLAEIRRRSWSAVPEATTSVDGAPSS